MSTKVENCTSDIELNVGLPRLFTPKQAAQMLNISERTLWTITRRGDVPHVRIGRSVRYSVNALNRWIQERQHCTCRHDCPGSL